MAGVKKRLDVLLVERGLVESREKAQALIMAGEVLVGGHAAAQVAARVEESADISIREPLPFASRGGYKLAGALDEFRVTPEGKVCVDIGASTGGFTDVLLQRDAARVYAIDVGYGQLAWKLRQDPRVVVMDRVNARYLDELPELADLVVVDVSFISIELILRAARRLLTPTGQVIGLVKPQFEAGRERVERGGIIRNVETHRAVLERVVKASRELGYNVIGLARSRLAGTEGNVEFFIRLTQDPSLAPVDTNIAIARLL